MGAYVLPTLQLGSRGDDVRKLQSYLKLLGQSLAVDGVYGPETRQAVINFQALSGVPKDGMVGPLTWKAIEVNLGYSVDVGGAEIPENQGELPEPFFTPTKLIAGGLLLVGLAAILRGGRNR